MMFPRAYYAMFCLLTLGAAHALGSINPPPDPSASCAAAEYAALRDNQTQTKASALSEAPTLVVVHGDVQRHLNTSQQIEMGRTVTVCVMGLYDWLYNRKHNPADLHLLVGGQILKGLATPALAPPGQEYVNFTLRVDSADSEDWKAWAAIVDGARRSVTNTLPISIANNNQAYETNAFTTVPRYPQYWYYLVVFFLFLFVAFVYLAVSTPLLRAAYGAVSAEAAPFSLGQVQMAFWTLLALAAYMYICLSTLVIHIPMGSMLGLLGISATTGLASIAVDSRKDTASRQRRKLLIAERSSLNARIEDLVPLAVAASPEFQKELTDRRARMAEVNTLIAQLPEPPRRSSKGFLQDILSDGDGISFHRFQIAAWTLVLGAVFVWSVYRNMAMPEFDASLLTLMGISSSTYVGFKFPESQKS